MAKKKEENQGSQENQEDYTVPDEQLSNENPNSQENQENESVSGEDVLREHEERLRMLEFKTGMRTYWKWHLKNQPMKNI